MYKVLVSFQECLADGCRAPVLMSGINPHDTWRMSHFTSFLCLYMCSASIYTSFNFSSQTAIAEILSKQVVDGKMKYYVHYVDCELSFFVLCLHLCVLLRTLVCSLTHSSQQASGRVGNRGQDRCIQSVLSKKRKQTFEEHQLQTCFPRRLRSALACL